MPLFEVLSSLKGSTHFNAAFQPAGVAATSGGIQTNCEMCDRQSLSPVAAPPTDVVSNLRWYDKNRGLNDTQVKGKLKKMSKSPVHFHRMSHFLENGHIIERSSDPCQSELFRGRSPPAAYIQGDAHLGNFGVVTTANGQPAYSVNDYDHTGYGTVDMDLKRLATSTVLWSRARGATTDQQRQAVEVAAQTYFDTVNSTLNGWEGGDPSRLHLPAQLVQPNGYIASLLQNANKESLAQFVDSKIKTDPKTGEITLLKTDPVDANTRAQLCGVISDWSAQLPENRQNFSILAVGKGRDSGGSSAGLDRFRILLQDVSGSRHLVEIKNAPPSSVEDQTGLNKFDADKMIQVQNQMGEHDSYAGSIWMNDKSFFTRELHPHKAIEKNIGDMSVANVQEAARAAGGILARAHTAVLRDPEALGDWVGQDKIEQAQAAKRLWDYAADYANTTTQFQGEVAKHLAKEKKAAAKKN